VKEESSLPYFPVCLFFHPPFHGLDSAGLPPGAVVPVVRGTRCGAACCPAGTEWAYSILR